jgi:hypothetical protein
MVPRSSADHLNRLHAAGNRPIANSNVRCYRPTRSSPVSRPSVPAAAMPCTATILSHTGTKYWNCHPSAPKSLNVSVAGCLGRAARRASRVPRARGGRAGLPDDRHRIAVQGLLEPPGSQKGKDLRRFPFNDRLDGSLMHQGDTLDRMQPCQGGFTGTGVSQRIIRRRLAPLDRLTGPRGQGGVYLSCGCQESRRSRKIDAPASPFVTAPAQR